MSGRKRLFKELKWFFGTIAGGLTVFLFICQLLKIEVDLVVILLGAISSLLAVYVVRLTVWVFNQNM